MHIHVESCCPAENVKIEAGVDLGRSQREGGWDGVLPFLLICQIK